ncbi:tRNA-dihydrouridine synthase family protein [Candidatus Pacearchaeota archaeon]|nr:tRNA-dihydrouridine synthase family protein [Candidatus Pacearchaeota archaeon]
MKSFKIGNIKLKNPLLLAPMVDVTDLPYRLICRKAGAALAYTEMLNVGAILHENEKTRRLMKTCADDRPIGIQITGPKVSEFRTVIPILKTGNYDLIDINCGCPSIRTLDNESGSFLLKKPEKIASYIKILKDNGFITTAKIRLGFRNNNIVKIAKLIEKSGADALTIHARLAHDSYKIPADWKFISDVKKQIGIPVIGNGDITDGKQTTEMLKIADGAMIARAAIGDPLIFKRILNYLKTGKEEGFDFSSNIKMFDEYLRLAKKYEVCDLPRIKFIGANFLRNVKGAAKMRADLMQKKSLEEIEEFVGSMIFDI